MNILLTKRAVPAGAAIACLLLPIATLAGWGLHSPLMIGAGIGAPQMYPLSAVGFLFAGISVLLQLHPVRPIARAGRVPALLLVAIGLGGAAMRLSGWAPAPLSLGLGIASSAWSLPAPLTCGLLVVLGASLALVGVRRTVGFAQALAASVLLFALLTIAGFAAEDTFLYQLLPGRGTSLRTSLAFMLAATGVLALRPDQGMVVALASSTPSSRTLRRLMAPLVLAPIALGMVATAAVRAADPAST